MNEVQVIIDKCRKHGQATLRGIWPGRGKAPKARRANAKKAFGEQQLVKEEQVIDGETKEVVVATITYFKGPGIYQLAS
jgi:hypothetical protein